MSTQLAAWAEHGREIVAIMDAVDSLEKSGHIAWESAEQPRKAIARLYDIDLSKLDDERRALLDRQRELNV